MEIFRRNVKENADGTYDVVMDPDVVFDGDWSIVTDEIEEAGLPINKVNLMYTGNFGEDLKYAKTNEDEKYWFETMRDVIYELNSFHMFKYNTFHKCETDVIEYVMKAYHIDSDKIIFDINLRK